MEKATKKEYYDYKLDGKKVPLEKRILYKIVADFTDRRGLRQQWEEIDEDIQEEIMNKWLSFVVEEVNTM